MRPQTLAEVAEIIRDQPDRRAIAIDEFCDAFYLDYPDREAMQKHLDPVPEVVGSPIADAWIGATGEHLATRWGLKIPPWTARPEHFALVEPFFMPPSPALRQALIFESPPAFRGRLIFTMAEPLKRARFPIEVHSTRG